MKIIIAGLIMLQQIVFLAAPAALAGCSTQAERADVRQETRIENRTEGRYENRRGED